MKRKLSYLLLFLTAFCFPTKAQAQEAQVFAQKVQRAYEFTEDLKMDFVQKTYVAILEKEVSKKGTAQFRKPGKFAIVYEGSRGRQYLSNGKTLWIYETGDSQVQSFSVNDDTVPAEALSFLGGLGNLKRDFVVEEVEAKKLTQLRPEKTSLRWLELTPLKKKSTIQWLVMGFDKESGLAQELFISTESGNLSHYVFSNIVPNSGIGQEVFEFKK